jgi:hypothetical protein
VKLTEGANTETVRIKSVATLVNTVYPALTKAYTVAAVVSLYQKAAAAFIYHESSDQFRLMYTNNLAVSGNVADPAVGGYADRRLEVCLDLHVACPRRPSVLPHVVVATEPDVTHLQET